MHRPGMLPPLTAIRVFDAVARHGSFTKAAQELGMTQAAVSYQIKMLEERAGAPLFLRRPRQITLTEVGARLAPAVGDAFDTLAAAWMAARGNAQGTLVISTTQTFAANWLAKHLGTFQVGHPDLAVKLQADNKVADFARDEVDVAIRAGGGHWPGMVHHFLLRADFTPMLSPRLAERVGGVSDPADLLKLPLIDPKDRWWPQWLKAAGLPVDSLDGRPASDLGSQALVAGAAIAAQGVALLTPAFYAAELADGRLIQPFDIVCYDGSAYWLVYPESRRNNPKVAAFRQWLLQQFPAGAGQEDAEPKSDRGD